MKRILWTAPLSILLMFGSACIVSEADAPKPTPKATGQLKAMLQSARIELREYEEKLSKTEQEIRDKQGNLSYTVSPRLLDQRELLKEKILQSKVNVRELEILLNEE